MFLTFVRQTPLRIVLMCVILVITNQDFITVKATACCLLLPSVCNDLLTYLSPTNRLSPLQAKAGVSLMPISSVPLPGTFNLVFIQYVWDGELCQGHAHLGHIISLHCCPPHRTKCSRMGGSWDGCADCPSAHLLDLGQGLLPEVCLAVI